MWSGEVDGGGLVVAGGQLGHLVIRHRHRPPRLGVRPGSNGWIFATGRQSATHINKRLNDP